MIAKSILATAAAFACLAAMPAARAQTLNFTLNPAAQVGQPGDTFHFSGTLTNPTAGDVFLNGDSLTFNGPTNGLTLDDSPFFANAPASLGASGSGSDTFTGGLFDVSASTLAAPGTYYGTFGSAGGADGSAQDVLASQDFSVTVQAVPEASSVVSLGLLLMLGLGGVAVARRRKPA